VKRDSIFRRGARDRLAVIDKIIAAEYGTPESVLGNQIDPLDEAIYIILSFQTDLPRAQQTWSRLKLKYNNWEALERAPIRELEKILQYGGLHRQKARTLKALLKSIRQQWGSLSLDFLHALSDSEAERVLTKLPGLSWKAARCVLLYSLRRSAFPVDGNTFRILKRTGVLYSSAIYRRRSLHDGLQAAVSPARRRALHVNLVIHGQRTCLPQSPHCSRCPVRPACIMSGIESTRASVR
jgi:endonuclease-3